MKWSDTIRFHQPPRQVSLLADAPAQSWVEVLRLREEAAYQRGRQEAERDLNQQMVKQHDEAAERQRAVLESLNRAVPQVIKETETGLISLALEAAGRVVAGLPISVELVEAVVGEALRQVEATAQVVVQLHPEDLELLQRHDSKLLAGSPESGSLRFITAAEVTRGGCLVQTRFGLIDARREAKLEQLAQTANS